MHLAKILKLSLYSEMARLFIYVQRLNNGVLSHFKLQNSSKLLFECYKALISTFYPVFNYKLTLVLLILKYISYIFTYNVFFLK